MKSYRLLAMAAGNVRTDEKTMLEFNRAGWIDVISKDGRAFVSGQDEYRARFILHLREKLKLTNTQIGIVLANETPPYSLNEVPVILARHLTER